MPLIHNSKNLALLVISQRKKLKLSQSEVADLVGLKQKTISSFENRPENTKLDTLFRILSAVNLHIVAQDKGEPISTQDTWKEEW